MGAGDQEARRRERQRRRQLRLGLKRNLVWDLGLAAPRRVGTPLLGQVEREAQGHRAPLAHRVHAHRDLAVADLAQGTGVLPLHPGGVGAVLWDAGVVDDPGRKVKLGSHPLGAGAQEQIRVPGRVGQELLHGLIAGGVLSQAQKGGLQALAAPCSISPRT